MQPKHTNDSREVNDLLHTLRGEQFRHMQNLRQSRTHLSSLRSYNSPTLPIYQTIQDNADADEPSGQSISTSYSGPAPPKSWTSANKDDRDTVAWRTQALSLAASHLGNFTTKPRVPSLALLCLQTILSDCTSSTEFRRDVIPYIPPHLRRDVVRYCAIHCPLPNWKLYSLFGQSGNTDGEMLIMGPTASLQDDLFIRGEGAAEERNGSSESANGNQIKTDWESEDPSEVLPLRSLIVVSTRLSTTRILALPSTITQMALINLPNSIPLHRLPKTCPLLVLLDLSYNSWLKDPGEGAKSLEKTVWTRWKYLEILGLRDCYVSDSLLSKINAGRWDDVTVIRD